MREKNFFHLEKDFFRKEEKRRKNVRIVIAVRINPLFSREFDASRNKPAEDDMTNKRNFIILDSFVEKS